MFSVAALQRYLSTSRPSLEPFKKMSGQRLRSMIVQEGFMVNFRTEPREYQWAPLYLALKHKQMLLFMGPRTGKTKVALDYVTALKDFHARSKRDRPRFLVLVPSDEVASVWESLGHEHSHLSIDVAYPPTAHRREIIENSTADLLVVPFSGIQALGTVRGQKRGGRNGLLKNEEELIRLFGGFAGVIIDESHHVKEARTLRYKMIQTIVQGKPYRLALTGTPFGRDPLALWPQFYAVDGGLTLGSNRYFFEQAFSRPSSSPFKMYEFDHRKNPILRRKGWGGSYTITTMEALGVSAVEHNKVRLRPTREQHERMMEIIKKFGGAVDIKMTYMQMRQIASSFLRLPNGRDIDIGECPKRGWIASELEDFEGQAVIFYVFTHSGKQLSKLIESMKIPFVWIHGDNKDNPAGIDAFRKGKAQVAIVQYLIGSEGLDLSMADRIIYHELPDRVISYTQSDFRAVSLSRNKPLVVDDLMTSHIEETISKYMREGQDLFQDLLTSPQAFLTKGLDEWTPR